MILFHKELDQINEETLTQLEAMGVNDSTPGDMVRILLSIINEQVDGYYTTLKENHLQAFVSHASGPRLEAIGELLQCNRRPGEDDGNYRFRITHENRNKAAANETAIRLSALSVAGVEDAIIRPYSHGTGSFTVYLIIDPNFDDIEVINNVTDAIAEARALGIRTDVLLPFERELEVKIRIIFNKDTKEVEKAILLNQVKEQIRLELSQMTIGESLLVEKFERIARSIIPTLESVTIFDMRINNRAVLIKDYQTRWDERIVESPKHNAIMVI